MAEQNSNAALETANKQIADLRARLDALEAAPKNTVAGPYRPSAKKPYAKVNYHTDYNKPVVMYVLDENSDGTVNIGMDDNIVVRNAQVCKTPTVGHVTQFGKASASEAAESDE